MNNTEIDINLDNLTAYIKDSVDKRFDQLVSDRNKIEAEWKDIILAATEGKAPSPHKKALVEMYTNLNDMTFPVNARKLHARETAWLDKDFFRWQPDGVESTDTQGAYWLTNWQKANLNNQLSNFHDVIRACLWERNNLNISAMNVLWETKPKFQLDYEKGGEMVQKPYEFDLQGLKFEFVSIFNVYPDVIGQTSFHNLNSLDIYHKSYKTKKEILDDGLWNGRADYKFECNVLFRNPDLENSLKVFDNRSASYSQAQIELNKSLSEQIDFKNKDKNKIEIRKAIIKSIKLPDQPIFTGNGRGVALTYAKAGSTFVPLFLEILPFQFERKSIRLSRRWIDPYNLYNSSETGIAFNQHSYIVTSKQQQATAIARATMPNRFWDVSILDAFQGTIDEFKKTFTQTGANKFIDVSKLQQAGFDVTKPITMGEPEDMLKNIQVIQQAIDSARNDIMSINTQVNQESGAGATAQYNKQVAQELDMMSRESKASTCRDWLEPALQLGCEYAKFLFEDEKVTSDITKEDQAEMVEHFKGEMPPTMSEGTDWEAFKKYCAERKSPIINYHTLGKPDDLNSPQMGVMYNPLTEKKQAIISRALFKNTTASLLLEFEESEYSKPMELQETVQIFGQIMANIPDSGLKFEIAKIAIDRTLQLTNDPEAEAISERLQKELEKMTAPPPPEQQMAQMEQAQAQTQAIQAKASKDNAQANHMQANANKTNQEVQDNEQAKQLLGV